MTIENKVTSRSSATAPSVVINREDAPHRCPSCATRCGRPEREHKKDQEQETDRNTPWYSDSRKTKEVSGGLKVAAFYARV
jgi:hypothetical protein